MSRAGSKRRGAEVAYVLMRFPTLTETFVLREIIELERQGLPIDLYVALPRSERAIHPRSVPYAARMRTASYLDPGTLAANLGCLVKRPRRYLSLLRDTVEELWGSWNLLARALYLLPRAAAFAAQMKAAGIRHVHAHFATHGAYVAYAVHRLAGIGFSFTAHAHDLYIRRAMLCRKVEAASFVATISEFNRALLARECGPAVSGKVELVRCGVGIGSSAPPGRSLPRPEDPFRVLTVARLRDYKGLPYLLEACSRARPHVPNLHLQIIGDGPDRRKLERLASSLDLGDIVTFAGALPEEAVVARMRDSHAFVLPSIVMPDGRMEGIPVVLMEALASELPTIATSISGIPELIVDRETGLLVPQRDADALAEALIDVARNYGRALELGRRGRARVESRFSLAENVSKLRDLLESQAEGSEQ